MAGQDRCQARRQIKKELERDRQKEKARKREKKERWRKSEGERKTKVLTIDSDCLIAAEPHKQEFKKVHNNYH